MPWVLHRHEDLWENNAAQARYCNWQLIFWDRLHALFLFFLSHDAVERHGGNATAASFRLWSYAVVLSSPRDSLEFRSHGGKKTQRIDWSGCGTLRYWSQCRYGSLQQLHWPPGSVSFTASQRLAPHLLARVSNQMQEKINKKKKKKVHTVTIQQKVRFFQTKHGDKCWWTA